MSLRMGSNWGMPGATRSGHRFRFEARQEEWQRKYHKAIAEDLDDLVVRGEVDRLILEGAEREAHGVLRAMHERAADQVAGVVRIPPTRPRRRSSSAARK